MTLTGKYDAVFEDKDTWERIYIMRDWDKYKLVKRASDMLSLLNVLEAYNESLYTLLQFIKNNETVFCGIDWSGNPDGKQKAAELILSHNIFYNSQYDFVTACMREHFATGMSLNEFIAREDIRKTSNGYVRVLRGSIAKNSV